MVVQRSQLHSLYALVLLDAEVVHGRFKGARVSQTTKLLKVPGATSHY